MIVYAEQLKNAAADMRARGMQRGKLKEPVPVTPEQLEAAGQILADGPQPICNGIKDQMPGFIEAEQQEQEDVLVFQVGILPSRTYRIAQDGTVLRAAGETP